MISSKNSKFPQVNFFVFQKKVIQSLQTVSKTHFYQSLNGFEFKPLKKTSQLTQAFKKALKKQKAQTQVYQRVIIRGSERLNPQNLTVQGVFPDSQKLHEIVFYDYQHSKGNISVGVLAVDKYNSHQVIWRHTQPVFQSPLNWHGQDVKLITLLKFNQKYLAYYQLPFSGIKVICYPEYRLSKMIKLKNCLKIKKSPANPIISPHPHHPWEQFTTMNAAALYHANKVHLLYRAQGYDYFSSLGYANSKNGLTIDFRENKPAYVAREAFEIHDPQKPINPQYVSAGSKQGCEDPRITKIKNRIYLTYVAFNGVDPPRIALTSIKLTHFLQKKWLWQKPILISPPGVVDKSPCLLPEKINGQYVIFHRIFPNILVDYLDSLNFKPGQYLKGQYQIKPRGPNWWDSRKIGAGAPPLKTKKGWLLIYQAVDDKDSGHYQLGAMLLDLTKPHQVICRSRYPILEPSDWYENYGFKAGVVYSCGAVIIKNTLFVYYGAADSYVCLATAQLDQFLDKLIKQSKLKLEAAALGIIQS